MIAYRHGCRAHRANRTAREQITSRAGVAHLTKRKNSSPSTHPCAGSSCAGCASGCARKPSISMSRLHFAAPVRTVHCVVTEAGRVTRIGFSRLPASDFPFGASRKCLYFIHEFGDSYATCADWVSKRYQPAVPGWGGYRSRPWRGRAGQDRSSGSLTVVSRSRPHGQDRMVRES